MLTVWLADSSMCEAQMFTCVWSTFTTDVGPLFMCSSKTKSYVTLSDKFWCAHTQTCAHRRVRTCMHAHIQTMDGHQLTQKQGSSVLHVSTRWFWCNPLLIGFILKFERSKHPSVHFLSWLNPALIVKVAKAHYGCLETKMVWQVISLLRGLVETSNHLYVHSHPQIIYYCQFV